MNMSDVPPADDSQVKLTHQKPGEEIPEKVSTLRALGLPAVLALKVARAVLYQFLQLCLRVEIYCKVSDVGGSHAGTFTADPASWLH